MASAARRVSIGCGSAFAEDRVDWAVELAETGLVSYMGFDCLAERSVGLANLRKTKPAEIGVTGEVGLRRPMPDVAKAPPIGHGYDPRLQRIIRDFVPFLASGGRIVGNFGAANPEGAGEEVIAGFKRAGLEGKSVGVITGDDVLEQVLDLNLELPEKGIRVQDIRSKVLSANAYIGMEGIIKLLADGADVVVGGRLTDSAIFAGPICYELGWSIDDLDRVALAICAGHLLECGTHVTGGNFPDPPMQSVPRPWDLGFPFAEVSANGELVVSKDPNKGGAVNSRTVKAQLGYEVHDPSKYLTPEVTADFSMATVEEIGPDRVRVSGITGKPRPPLLRVLVTVDLGWRANVEIGYAGPGCLERAQLAVEIVHKRLERLQPEIIDLDVDIVGWNSVFGDQLNRGYPSEVRVRTAAICKTMEGAAEVLLEGQYIVFGPAAGGAGRTSSLEPAIGVTPTSIPRELVTIKTNLASASL